MVLYLLQLKAELEGVGSVRLVHDANLCINVRNPQSSDEVREKVVLNPSVTVEQDEHAREPPHHFSLRWEGNKKAATLTVLSEAETKTALKKKKSKAELPREYTAEDSGSWVPILAVECRGLEPSAFFPMGTEFIVTSEGGVEFTEDVDLGEGDWADYDAENDQAVSMSDIAFEWRPI